MENNMSVIQVNEDRSFINKAKKAMNLEHIREEYQKKYIDTGKAQELETKIEESAKRKKKIIKVAGAVATVALVFIPADGPFGELCTVLATPALCALVDVSADIKKKALITEKRAVEKYVLHVDGTNKDVKGFSLDRKELTEDFTKLKEAVNDLEGGFNK